MSSTRWLAAVLVLAPLLSGSSWAGALWPTMNDADVEAGQRAYRSGDYLAASDAFRRALRGDGDSDRLQFDIGTALLQVAMRESDAEAREHSLDLAIVSLRSATDTELLSLREKALYNLGNAMILRERYDEAADAYRQVLRANSDHDDARHNLEVALLGMRAKQAEAGSSGDAKGAQGTARDGMGTGSESSTSQPSGAQDPSQGGDGDGQSQSPGPRDGTREAQGKRDAPAAGQETNSDRAMRADLGPKTAQKSMQGIGLMQKLEALERRSGELRREGLLRKTRARLRTPDKPGSQH